MKKLILCFFLALSVSGQLFAERDTLRVYFDSGDSQISGFQKELIDIFLKTHYSMGVMVVAGHSDAIGDARTNLLASQSRARVVARYLLSNGFDPSKILLEAWGETAPLVEDNSAMAMARNRRVELVGIPNPSLADLPKSIANADLALDDTTTVAYREMTTPDGKPKRRWVITLDKPDLNPYSGLPPQMPQSPQDLCANAPMIPFAIMTEEEKRCPISQIWFDDTGYHTGMSGTLPNQNYLKPVKTDSGWVFIVMIPDRRACSAPTVTIGDGCHTEQPVSLRLDRVKARELRGVIAETNERFNPSLDSRGNMKLHIINNDPKSLQIVTTMYRKRGRKLPVSVSLAALPYDAATNTYTIGPKEFKGLRKQFKQ